jgi:hypothetical protein
MVRRVSAEEDLVDPARRVAAVVRDEWGLSLDVLYRCETGAEGVYAVRSATRRLAMRFWPGAADAGAVFAGIYARLSVLRACGVPIPATYAAGPAGKDFVELSEWVDGEVSATSSGNAVAQVVAVADRMRGAAIGSGERWASWLTHSLDDDVAGFFRPATLKQAGGAYAELLVAGQGIMSRYASERLYAGDVVHGDFGLGNCLFRDGELVAVVDWSGCRDGSSAFDLTAVMFDLGADDEAVVAIRRRLGDCGVADRATCAAHYAARHVAGALRHGSPSDALARAWNELEPFA